MNQNEVPEVPENEIDMIALHLCSGIAPIRKEVKGRIITYYFPKAQVEEALKRLACPEMALFKAYIHTRKVVQAEANAVRSAAHRSYK